LSSTQTTVQYQFAYKFGSNGTGNGQFQDPHDISFDSTGRVFVTDRIRNDIQIFTHEGTYITKFGGSGSTNGLFNVPYSCGHDKDDNLYVADRGNNRVQKFNSSNTFVSKITSVNGQSLNAPEDVIFDPINGDIYICDTGNNRVVKLDKDHNFILQWGTFGNGPGQFDHPHSSSTDTTGNFVFINSGNQPYIQKFDKNGNFIKQWGEAGTQNGQLLTFLEHMDIDKKNRLHIINNNARPVVQVFDLNGNFLTKYGMETEGSADGQFREPEHITCDSQNRPFVVDANNQRVQVFNVIEPPAPPPVVIPPVTTPSTDTDTSIISDTDLKFYLSGGFFNPDPKQSLGGEISSFGLASGSLNGLFDRVDTAEAETGDEEYRCIYLRNTHQTRKLLGCKIWIETGTASADTWISISLGSAGVNGVEPMIPDEGIAPPMHFFDIPLQQPEDPNIGDLYPGDHIALWIKWSVFTGTQTEANDFAVLRLDGEREPESITPIPDPDPPPPITCPTGQVYDPTQQKCVPINTPIVCPNGYTYDTVTQRCKPPSTPPPTVPVYKVAINGDFACTGDNDDTMDLIAGRLNLAAGPDQSLFIANGDFSYNDSNQQCWIDSTKGLGAMFPNAIAPTIGNHDDTEDGTAAARTQIINAYPLIPSEGYYAITRRNIRFIFMDTQRSYSSGSAQHTFVVNALNAAKADPAIKWVIVSYHKPSLNSDMHHAALTDLRNLYHPLFEANGKVVHVNSGHNHIYLRSKPIKFNSASPNSPTIVTNQADGNYLNMLNGGGIIYCITGTGGRSSNHEFGDTPEPYVGSRRLPEPYGTTFMTLEDNGNRLSFEYVLNDGTVFDAYQISSPGASTPAPIVCPTGYNWDETLGRCVASPQSCPSGQHWDPAQARCVPDTGTPPPPTSPGYPVTNVEWYYDSATVLATNATLSAGSHGSDGVLLASTASGVSSVAISGGYVLIESGGGNGRVYWDYHTLPRWAQDDKPGFNLAMAFEWVYEGQDNCSVKDGNHGTGGFAFENSLVFGGFGFSLHSGEVQSKVEYWHNEQGTEVSSAYPGNRTLVSGKTYKVFFTLRTNRTNETVVMNIWMDFDNGTTPVWTKILSERVWSKSNWSPGSVPSGDDRDDILEGPSHIKRHHVWIRNNGGGADMKVKGVKIGTLPFLPETSTPPTNPPTNPPPTTPPPTGGQTDSNGILWLHATGTQGVIGKSRDQTNDFRWSANVSGLRRDGYEATGYFTFSGTNSSSHWALKHWGGNHSGDCVEFDGGCCCWYDTGIRVNGEVQLQTERPHPSNHDFNLTFNATSGPLYMTNIGKSMNGNTIGLKWVIFPVTPNGTAEEGGIHLIMYVDTSGLLNGRPQNQWRKVYDFIDSGQVLGDGYEPDDNQEIESRNSDTNSTSTYAGGIHYRKIVR
jgi:hypothetical protein